MDRLNTILVSAFLLGVTPSAATFLLLEPLTPL